MLTFNRVYNRIPSSSSSTLINSICYSSQTSSSKSESLAASTSNSLRSSLPVRPATSNHPKPIPTHTLRLGVASLLSRSPLLLKPLTEFEDSYYQYQRELNHVISKPIRSSFFFRPGSHAAKAFELSLRSSQSSIPLDPFPSDPQNTRSNHLDENHSFHNIQRAPTRFIHLFFKLINPSNQTSHWQLPTSKILGPSDDLTQASLRAIYTNAGPDMDIWSVGKVPATVYAPPLESDSRFDKVWVMPQRILRGQPKMINSKSATSPSSSSTTSSRVVNQDVDQKSFQIEDFGWFCSEEIKDRVDLDLWKALEPILK